MDGQMDQQADIAIHRATLLLWLKIDSIVYTCLHMTFSVKSTSVHQL